MIEQTKSSCKPSHALLRQRGANLLSEHVKHLVHRMRRILCGIMEVAHHSLLPSSTHRGNSREVTGKVINTCLIDLPGMKSPSQTGSCVDNALLLALYQIVAQG